MDDFPWTEWAHKGPNDCPGPLELRDTGSSGSASDLVVKCSKCGSSNSMGAAFGRDAIAACTARRPWLSPKHHDKDGCNEPVRTILRGASNAYFAVVSSALSIPPWSDPIQQDLAPYRDLLKSVKGPEHMRLGIDNGFFDLGDLTSRYSDEEIWKALKAEAPPEDDLKRREYDAFLHPEARVDGTTEFEVSAVPIDERFKDTFSLAVAATRLREVRALRGFTRIDSVPDLGERTDVSDLEVRMSSLGPKDIDWRPGIDLRGEGIFLQLEPEAVQAWEAQANVIEEQQRLLAQFEEWRKSRSLDERPFPGMRYVLLHTLAHVLMRRLSLECGYSSSALRERIYCTSGSESMAGLLIYTASSDSDGSLGGLVDQATPDRLGPILFEGLREATFCASDPLCGGREIGASSNLNGAACHACLLMAETSCEFGNRLLDRATLTETLGDRSLSFFSV